MPDPILTTAFVESHSNLLGSSVEHRLRDSRRCKVWGGLVAAGVIVAAGWKSQPGMLPWAAGAIVLFAFADAACVAFARRAAGAYGRFMARVPLNGGNLPKAEEWFVPPETDLRMRDAGAVLGALGSFSVWPFYAALLVLVVGFHVQMSGNGFGGKSARLLPSEATKGCSAGGGCGTSGGCGSGGCGASAGKGCGCGSGAEAKPVKTATARAVAQPVQSIPSMKSMQPVQSPQSAPSAPGKPAGASGTMPAPPLQQTQGTQQPQALPPLGRPLPQGQRTLLPAGGAARPFNPPGQPPGTPAIPGVQRVQVAPLRPGQRPVPAPPAAPTQPPAPVESAPSVPPAAPATPAAPIAPATLPNADAPPRPHHRLQMGLLRRSERRHRGTRGTTDFIHGRHSKHGSSKATSIPVSVHQVISVPFREIRGLHSLHSAVPKGARDHGELLETRNEGAGETVECGGKRKRLCKKSATKEENCNPCCAASGHPARSRRHSRLEARWPRRQGCLCSGPARAFYRVSNDPAPVRVVLST